MARRIKSKRRSKDSKQVKDLPKGMQVAVESGGDLDEVEKHFERAYKNTMLYLKDGDEETIAFLTMPEDFARFGEHRVQSNLDGKFYLPPCTGSSCLVCEQYEDSTTTICAHVPIYVYSDKSVRLFRATPVVMKELIRLARRRTKRFLTRHWTLEREGEGLDTTYRFYDESEKVGDEIDDIEIPDSQKILNDQLRLALTSVGLNQNADDDDYDDYDEYDDDEYDDDDDDDNDDDDNEEELLPRRKSQSKDKKNRSRRNKTRSRR